MQKVVGSNPISRSYRSPAQARFSRNPRERIRFLHSAPLAGVALRISVLDPPTKARQCGVIQLESFRVIVEKIGVYAPPMAEQRDDQRSRLQEYQQRFEQLTAAAREEFGRQAPEVLDKLAATAKNIGQRLDEMASEARRTREEKEATTSEGPGTPGRQHSGWNDTEERI